MLRRRVKKCLRVARLRLPRRLSSPPSMVRAIPGRGNMRFSCSALADYRLKVGVITEVCRCYPEHHLSFSFMRLHMHFPFDIS